MSQPSASGSNHPVSNRQIEKTIKQSVKQVLAQHGLVASTRQGNQELNYLVTRIARQPFSGLEAAQVLGQQLGQKIVELSQAMGRQHLDRRVIQQLVLLKQVPAIERLPEALVQPKVDGIEPAHPSEVPKQPEKEIDIAEGMLEAQADQELEEPDTVEVVIAEADELVADELTDAETDHPATPDNEDTAEAELGDEENKEVAAELISTDLDTALDEELDSATDKANEETDIVEAEFISADRNEELNSTTEEANPDEETDTDEDKEAVLDAEEDTSHSATPMTIAATGSDLC